MPKSSRPMRTPSRESCSSSSDSVALAAIRAVSVTSRCSRSGASPDASSMPMTLSAKPDRASWLGQTLTATHPPGARPAASRAASRQACASIQPPSGRMRPLLSASSRKRSGRQQPVVRVLPAHQRFVTDDGEVAEVDDRLVVRAQLLGAERHPQVVLELQVLAGRHPVVRRRRRRRTGRVPAASRAAAPCRRASALRRRCRDARRRFRRG